MALFSILARAAADECEFTSDERLLVAACEFWSAVSSGEMRAHLGSDPLKRLRTAGVAMTLLGADELAEAIFAGIDELGAMSTESQRDDYLARLESALQRTPDAVDVLIGLISHRCLSGVMPQRSGETDAVVH